jgi:pimeloyl-ACP methyl ester carboxylesterase
MTALRKRLRTGLAMMALLLASQHANATPIAESCPMADKLPLALARAQQYEREPGEFADVELLLPSFQRTPLVDDVVEYSFFLKVGPGDFDLIRLHRVVRERALCQPRVAHKAMFLLHGAPVDFRTSFLPSTLSSHVPREQSFAIFLAQRGLDVWGLDMRSTLIPANVTDFTFMQDWNYATDIHDIAISLALARWLRNLTGSGIGKMYLLGWSNGGMLTYAYANDETRFPLGQRHVKGLIPVDIAFKFSSDDEALRQAACTRAAVLKTLFLDAGVFQDDERATRTIGVLAETAPNDPSPFAPGLTNRTVVLLGGAVTWQVQFSSEFPPFVPFYHTLAGQFDPVSGLPTDLTFARASYLFDLLQEFPSWWVWREFFELNALQCNELDLLYDDHLAEVKVPLLYVGARGGFGEHGDYSTTLLGSRDVTTMTITLLPEQPLDFAHSDLFWADNAPTVAWEPIYQWMRRH